MKPVNHRMAFHLLAVTSLWLLSFGQAATDVKTKDQPDDVYDAVGNVHVTAFPDGVLQIQEGMTVTVDVNVSVTDLFPNEDGIYVLRAIPEDVSIAKLTELRRIDLPNEIHTDYFKLQVVGIHLGKTKLQFYVTNRKGDKLGTVRFWVSYFQEINVLRNVTVPTNHVHVISHAIVAVNMIIVGSKLDREEAANMIRRPLSLTLGFICRFGVLPGTVILLSDLFQLDAVASSGMLILAIMQAESASLLYILLFDGDLSLGLMMSFLFGLAGLGFAPLWFLIKDTYILSPGIDVELPYLGATSFLAVSVTLVVIGVVIRHFYPRFSNKSKRFHFPVAFISLCVALAVEYGGNQFVFRAITKKFVEAAAIFVVTSFAISALLGFITRRPGKQTITIIIETVLNTSAMTSLLLTQSYREPDADIAQTVSIAVSLISQSSLFVFALVYRVYQLCKNKPGDSQKRKAVTFAEAEELSDTFLEAEHIREAIREKLARSREGSMTSLYENGFDEVVDTKETNV